jgi:CheY-like chemotaxis protein
MMPDHTQAATPLGLLLSDDLMFTSRITGTAHGLGLTIKPARSVEALQALVQQQSPNCVIVDLANPGLVIADLIRWLRASCVLMPRVVAYGSHVDTATLRTAREAGCDVVLPRSKFVEELPSMLPEWMAAPEKREASAATVDFDSVWEAVRTLRPQELERLRRLIDALLANPALQVSDDRLTKEDRLDLILLKKGLLGRIPPPPTEGDLKAFREWKPLPLEGKPLSETIIEERR